MRPLTVGSLFSGVGGFEMGFERAGFVTRWQCEIDPDATSVLERHWPNVRRYRDVTEVDPADLEPVDVITFGSPCQGFSVAGTRGGLDDHRSGLFGEAIRIIRGLRPAVAVWENVPGAFSTDDGRDFGAVLAALAESGALDIAWRVLDAQWFGVPQRRRRIFLVADFGGERAAQVLFESEGVRGDSQAGREAWEGTAPDAEGGTGSSDELVPCLMASGAGFARTGGPDFCVPDVAFTLAASGRHTGDGHGNAWNTTYLPVDLTNGSAGGDIAGTLTTELERGNRGQFVAVGGEAVRDCLTAHGGPHGRLDAESETFVVAPWDEAQITSAANRSRVDPGMPAPTRSGSGLASIAVASCDTRSYGNGTPRGDGSDNLIAFHATQSPVNGSVSPALGSSAQVGDADLRITHTLSTRSGATEDGTGRGTPQAASPGGTAVRRLTPHECERLMGWPDVKENVTIHVWNKAHQGDKSPGSAIAATPCTTAPASALPADESASPPLVKRAELSSCTLHPDREPRAALRVLIDLGRRAVEISSPGVPSLHVNNADGSGWNGPRVNADAFVRLVALTSSCLGRTAPPGRAASHQFTTLSTPQQSGSRCVVVSGPEIEEPADDVDTVSRAASGLLTSTTSLAGRSSQDFDSILTTLCCSVMHAIAGFIPEPIRTGSSYDVDLTISSGWTQFRGDGREISDGPRYRMCGNGVVANVAEWIARRLRAALEAS